MFFFIGGIQPKTVRVSQPQRSCSECGHFGLTVKRTDQYVSVFFIPLFPVKRGIPFAVCENCSALFDEQGRRIDRGEAGAMKRCPSCGRPVAPDFSYCPYCGKPV